MSNGWKITITQSHIFSTVESLKCFRVPQFLWVWQHSAIAAFWKDRKKPSLFCRIISLQVGYFLPRITSSPKTDPQKSKRSYKKVSSQSWVCGLERCLDYLPYCMTLGSVRSVNRGWYIAAGRIHSFMWLPALHSSALLCVQTPPALHCPAQFCWSVFGSTLLCSLKEARPAFCSCHLLSDSFFWFSALFIWSVQLTCAPISGVIHFAPRVRVMNHNTKQHMTSSWWWSWGWQTAMWTF